MPRSPKSVLLSYELSRSCGRRPSSAAWPTPSAPTDPYLLGALGAVLTLPFPAWNAAVLARTVAITPEHLFGRVQSVRQLVSRLATPCGPLLAGLAYESFGGHATVLILLAAALLMAVTGSTLREPRHRIRQSID
ncbi:hypothetical protein [Actinoplanes sp. NPDC048796]|uniref:hypothetical protein n=1 Tax=Actinoplanes sp. NPDC048796 TaxID=3155640 RepID=UPI0033FC758A